MRVTPFGGVDEIGGNKFIVEDDSGTRICLDFGRRMGYTNEFFDEFLQPRSKAGIRDLLKLKILPKIDGIYRDEMVSIDTDFGNGADVFSDAYKKGSDYWDSPVISYEEFLEENDEPFIHGVFLSHAHFDHIQDISYLSPDIPIYCSKKTKLLAQVISQVSQGGKDMEFFHYKEPHIKLKNDSYRTWFPRTPEMKKKKKEVKKAKHGILDIEISLKKTRPNERQYLAVGNGDHVRIGDMRVKPIVTDHSVPGSYGFIVSSREHDLLYTGDIRFHGDPKKDLEHFLKQVDRDIDTMIIEGTRVKSDRMLTEKDVEEDIREKISNVEKLVMVDFPWKDVQRFHTIKRAAEENDRTLVIDPRLAYLLFRLHVEFPDEHENPRKMDKVAVYLRRKGSMLYSKSDYKKTDAGFLSKWGRNRAKKDKNLIKIRKKLEDGSASEEEKRAWRLATAHIRNGVRAYEIREEPEDYVLMLNYWRMNELFDLSPQGGDLSGSHYMKCMCEPFSEEMQIDEKKLINWLDHFNVSYDSTEKNGKKIIERKHVSGHASKPELLELISEINPDQIIPVHTEHPEEFEKELENTDVDVILPEYGESIKL